MCFDSCVHETKQGMDNASEKSSLVFAARLW